MCTDFMKHAAGREGARLPHLRVYLRENELYNRHPNAAEVLKILLLFCGVWAVMPRPFTVSQIQAIKCICRDHETECVRS